MELPGASQRVFKFAATLLFASMCGAAENAPIVLDQKVPPPLANREAEPSARLFRTQFEKDTNATANTPSSTLVREVTLGGLKSESWFLVKPNLGDWPANVRDRARMWIGVGVPSSVSTEGSLKVTFSQNGCGMTTELNNSYSTGGVMILGNDSQVKDGEADLGIQNLTHLNQIKAIICVIVYLPTST
ncbi:MAG: hypothetical protein QM790_15450 [Nibricoccus sp.]